MHNFGSDVGWNPNLGFVPRWWASAYLARAGDLHLLRLLHVLSCGPGGCVLSGQHMSCHSQHKKFDTQLPFSGQVAQDVLGEQGCWIGFCTDENTF